MLIPDAHQTLISACAASTVLEDGLGDAFERRASELAARAIIHDAKARDLERLAAEERVEEARLRVLASNHERSARPWRGSKVQKWRRNTSLVNAESGKEKPGMLHRAKLLGSPLPAPKNGK
ncbi:hypothetical protein HGRIS_000277 [Hohenbuehelia grisea]|uniref:Uncharacterized protein n=1 Tax=Hohenbuehelia grisea TaxID=104357 RepID=A0ABR3JQQ9_9AGAR